MAGDTHNASPTDINQECLHNHPSLRSLALKHCNSKQRSDFISELAEIVQTKKHKPTIKIAISHKDNCNINVPKYNFSNKVLSLIHNPHIMTKETIIPRYNVSTGKSDDGHFWDFSSLDSPCTVPRPIDPNRIISEINTPTLFQKSVAQFCNKSHHMPVPLIFFYDKVNADKYGSLAAATVICTLGFFRTIVCCKQSAWRMLGLVPNLDIGSGKSSTKTAVSK